MRFPSLCRSAPELPDMNPCGMQTSSLHVRKGRAHRGATCTAAFGNARENGPTNCLCSTANVGSTMCSTGPGSSRTSATHSLCAGGARPRHALHAAPVKLLSTTRRECVHMKGRAARALAAIARRAVTIRAPSLRATLHTPCFTMLAGSEGRPAACCNKPLDTASRLRGRSSAARLVGAMGAWIQMPPLASRMAVMRTLVDVLLARLCSCSKIHSVPRSTSVRIVSRTSRGPSGKGNLPRAQRTQRALQPGLRSSCGPRRRRYEGQSACPLPGHAARACQAQSVLCRGPQKGTRTKTARCACSCRTAAGAGRRARAGARPVTAQ